MAVTHMAAAGKSKGSARLKEAAAATKRTSRKRPLHFAGSIHTLGHSTAKQAVATVKLDQQVRFHDGPPSGGVKHVDVMKTTVADFEVPNCGVYLHMRSLGLSRSKGLANNALATTNRA